MRAVLLVIAVLLGPMTLAMGSGTARAFLPDEEGLQADYALRGFVEGLWPEARAAGVSRATFEQALAQVQVDRSVLEAADNQPEHERALWEYLELLVSPVRMAEGHVKLREHEALLGAVEAAYGVDGRVLAAIWGIESNYGTNMGHHRVVRALAMLAWQGGKRSAFGRRELIAAMKILERGDIDAARMTGSWAGAMGHTQFIPSTYSAHAVDFDGDGRRDIWGTIADALASTANYLKVSGWRTGAPWGFEVVLPAAFDFALIEREMPLVQWAQLGLKRADGVPLAGPDEGSSQTGTQKATLIVPAGVGGPAFLVTQNFRAILRYNNAIAYALAVGHLSDRLAGAPAFVQAWPLGDRPLRRTEREELQALLAARGFDIGETDGLIGAKTKAALLAWQRSAGLPPDGYASLGLLARIKAEGRP